jgi:hypothetical protein
MKYTVWIIFNKNASYSIIINKKDELDLNMSIEY